MDTRLFCAAISVRRLICGVILLTADVALVVRSFGAIEVAMALMSYRNAFKAQDVDGSLRGLIPPLVYTGGLFVSPLYQLDSGLEVALWAIVAFRTWCLVSLGFSVSCGVSTFLGVKTRGPYAWVRHPMQLSGILARVIFCAAWPLPINLAGLVMMIAGSIAIVIAEESYLRTFEGWEDYAARVRFRLLPGVW